MKDEIQKQLTELAIERSKPFCYSCYHEAPTSVCISCGSDDLMRLVPGVGCEYGTDWIVEHILEEELEPIDLEEAFEQSVRDCYAENTSVDHGLSESIEFIRDRLTDIQRGWAKMTIAQKKRLLRRLIARLEVHPDRVGINYFLASGMETPGLLNVDFTAAETGAAGVQKNNVYPFKNRKPAESNLSVQNLRVLKNGDRGPIEFELNTVVREYRISWEKALADLTELAKLRWGRKWTEMKIAEHFGVSYNAVHMRLRGLKERNGCYERLSPAAKRLIPKA